MLIPTKQRRANTEPGIFLCGALGGGGGPIAGAMEVSKHPGAALERGPIIYEAHVPATREGALPPECTPVKVGHVQRIVGAFKSKPGFTKAVVRATRASNPFGGGKKPWVSAENPSMAESMATPNPRKQAPFEASVDWALQRLDNAPSPVD